MAALAAVSLVLAGAANAGEKIKISGETGKVDLPKEEKGATSHPSDFLGSSISGGVSSQAPVLPPPGQTPQLRNPKLEELWDRKKNWIFESPNSVGRDQAIKNILGVKDYEFSGTERKSKSLMEKYVERDKDNGSGTGSDRSGEEGSDRDSLSGRNRTANRSQDRDSIDGEIAQRPGIIPELNPALLFKWGMGPEPLAQIGDGLGRNPFLPRNLGEPGFGQGALGQPVRETTQPQQRDFEKLWESRKAPLGRITDPINDQSDATRFAIQPISARKAVAPPPPDASQGQGIPSFGLGSLPGSTARPDAFGFPGRDRVSPGSGIAPPAAAPTGPTIFQAKPAILEIPRPRF